MDKNIQELLETERQAQELITQARRDRDKRLREANDNAKQEIERLREVSNRKLQELKDENQQEIDIRTKEIEQQTETELQDFVDSMEGKLSQVADLLVKTVLTVDV